MKENAPKKIRFQTLRTLWVPLAIGVVTVAALAVVVGMVWKDYRTAMMDSQTRQMELVVQSTADSIRVLLEEYADRLDSIAGKAEASKAFRPTVARSDTIRDVWLENSNGEVIYSCYGLSAVCDVLITRTEDISYWQYHSGGEHYLVMKKKAGGETACLVVDSTVMYQQLISEIHVGRNGYIMIKNDDNLVVMHPEAVQWGIKVVEGRQRIYQGKELDMSSLSELLRAQQEEESGTLDYYSYWWADPDLPRVHKISAFRHLDVGGSFWIVSAVVDYDDFYEPVQQSFVKVALIFGGVALVLVLFIVILTTVAYTPILDLIPGYPGNKSRTMLIENIMRLDSLEKEIKNMQIYNENVALIMAGKNPVTRNDMQTADSASRSKNPTVGAIIEDSILRSQMENPGSAYSINNPDAARKTLRSALELFTPVKGVVASKFEPKEGAYGIRVVTTANQPVMAILDGTVISSSWTPSDGYVLFIQHSNKLTSVYRHNNEVIRKVGDRVRSGEIIGYTGSTQPDAAKKNLFEIELWHNGTPVDPQSYIVF